ncbi:MAG: Lrp/AsnC family transcriptional regulator [Candidatus Bathyarchaeia archaeon]
MSRVRGSVSVPRLGSYVPDDLDLFVLGKLIDNSTITFKEMAALAKTDQRTIAKRCECLRRAGILRPTVDIDWSKLGLTTTAFIGTATTHGRETREKLLDFLREEPRILEAYTTLGSHEYCFTVLDSNMQKLRAEIFDKLEPLTTGLRTSVIVKPIKFRDDKGLLRYLKRVRKRDKRISDG